MMLMEVDMAEETPVDVLAAAVTLTLDALLVLLNSLTLVTLVKFLLMSRQLPVNVDINMAWHLDVVHMDVAVMEITLDFLGHW